MRDFDAATWALGLSGKVTSASAYAMAVREIQMATRVLGRFHNRYDRLLTSTLADPPPAVGALQPRRSELQVTKMISRYEPGGFCPCSTRSVR